MTLEPVESSNLQAIGHDPDTSILHVQFRSGKIYQYHGVSAEQHRALMTSESKGRHFHQHVRGKFEFRTQQ